MLTTPENRPPTWRKSSRSCDSAACVEVAALSPGTVAVRDSKDADGSWLIFDRDTFRDFVEGDRRGDFGP